MSKMINDLEEVVVVLPPFAALCHQYFGTPGFGLVLLLFHSDICLKIFHAQIYTQNSYHYADICLVVLYFCLFRGYFDLHHPSALQARSVGLLLASLSLSQIQLRP